MVAKLWVFTNTNTAFFSCGNRVAFDEPWAFGKQAAAPAYQPIGDCPVPTQNMKPWNHTTSIFVVVNSWCTAATRTVTIRIKSLAQCPDSSSNNRISCSNCSSTISCFKTNSCTSSFSSRSSSCGRLWRTPVALHRSGFIIPRTIITSVHFGGHPTSHACSGDSISPRIRFIRYLYSCPIVVELDAFLALLTSRKKTILVSCTTFIWK